MLESAASDRLADTPLMVPEHPEVMNFIAAFRDDSGDRRAIDTPLLLALISRNAPPPPDLRVDEALWWATVAGDARAAESLVRPQGLLAADESIATMEAETEKELRSLHAASTFSSPYLTRRTNEAASWLIENIQPDNATHRPWAVHVFIQMAASGNIEADMYAQTLLHNATVGGRIDIFSAAILLHAARQLP